MKKILFVLILVFAVGFTVTSCKKEKKAETKTEMATNIYQCPMDCEHGKSYTKAGKCPVCKMDLKAKKPGEKTEVKKATEKHEHKEGDDHQH
jgi:transcription initiation factor IIE alpha subunit